MSVGIPPLFSPLYWDRSLEVADALRAEAAVHQAVMVGGVRVWVIARYDQAREALADTALSKDSAGLSAIIRRQLVEAGETGEMSDMFSPHMLFRDDPEHARLRKLVAPQFTRPRVDAQRPRIEQLTSRLLADLPRDRPVDLIKHFAFPLPLTVICELLGVPDDKRDSLREWTAALMEDHPARTVPASRAMKAYFEELIGAKRAEPGDDLLSALVHVCADEDRLTHEELVGTLFLLFVAGHETTTNLIGNSVRWLLADAERWRALGRRPELIPAAVEELLRFDSPVRMATHRYTTRDVVYGDVRIPAGELVLPSLQSANRDPARFDRPDQLDLGRDAQGHLAFGHGIHYCLGAALGRLEAEIVLGQLTTRCPHARLAVPEDQLREQRSTIMKGLVELPVLLGS